MRIHMGRYHDIKWYCHDVYKKMLHRIDGPALIKIGVYEEWYQNGLLHREDGPAVICRSGYRSWYQNGRLLVKKW